MCQSWDDIPDGNFRMIGVMRIDGQLYSVGVNGVTDAPEVWKIKASDLALYMIRSSHRISRENMVCKKDYHPQTMAIFKALNDRAGFDVFLHGLHEDREIEIRDAIDAIVRKDNS